jgi:Na+/proline symporter
MLVLAVVGYLAVTLAFGVWSSRLIHDSRDFTLAGRHLSASVVGITIFATWFGSSFVLGNPAAFLEDGAPAYVAGADIVALMVASLSIPLVALFAPLTLGLFWRRTTTAGAWTGMAAGTGVWLLCLGLGTRVDATLFGLAASLIGTAAVSLPGRQAPAGIPPP